MQSALPRATCAEQLTQSNLHRATCAEQLAQSNLQGAQFAQSNLQGATCRDQLAGATCSAQLAQTNLHRPVCAEHLAWCCLALASQMLRVRKKNASCSVWPASLAMLCFRANRGLVFCSLIEREPTYLHLHLSKNKSAHNGKVRVSIKNAQSSKNCARRFLLVWAKVRGVYNLDMHLSCKLFKNN